MLQWWAMGEKLSERLTIPMTPKMREQVDELADDLGVRAVDVGRLSLVFFIQNFEIMSAGLFAIKKQVEEESR